MRNNKNILLARAVALLALLSMLGVPARAADLSGTYSWNQVDIGAGGLITGFCTNPSNANVRFCRTDVGNAYRWDNTNSVWVPMIVRNTDGSGVPATAAPHPGASGCTAIATDPSNANVVYIAFPVVWSGDFNPYQIQNTVYKSTDGGKNFAATSLSVAGPPNGNAGGDRMQVDPNNSNILYYGSDQNGLWRSTDAGTTWTNLTTGGAPGTATNVINVAISKAGGTISAFGQTVSKILYCDVLSGDVYRSADGGQTWTNISTGTGLSGAPFRITVDQSANAWVGQQNSKNLWKYAGGVWSSVAMGFWNGVNNAAIDPSNPNRIFVNGVGGDIARSLDGGATWTVLVNYFIFANTLGWLPQTNAPAIFRSNAGVYFDANSVIWCPEGNEGMLSFAPSSDNHESSTNPPQWTIASQGINELVTKDIVIPKGSGDTAYVVTEDATGIVVHNPAAFTSTWVTLQGPTNLLANAEGAAWCPNAPSYVAISTSGSSNFSGYTTNAGGTWTVFSGASASGYPGSIAVSARGAWGLGSDHIVVLPYTNGLPVYSKDGGATWATCATFPFANGGFWTQYIYPRQLKADPFTPDKFFIKVDNGVNGALCVSTDGGVNWSIVSSALSKASPHGDVEMNFNVQNDMWFCDGWQGGTVHGLQHSTDGGVTWTSIPFFSYAYTIALGKGDGGTGHPNYAVYCYGTDTSGVFGVFRSVDGGSNWDRVSFFPAGIFDEPTAMAASWDTYGLVYVTFTGNTAVYGKITGGSPPPAPAGLTATPGNAQVALSWSASSGATSYNVLRSTVSGSGYASVATGIATTSYTNTGLTNGTTYYFVVTATNANGTSGNSNQASATPSSGPPPAPTGLTATAGNTQVALSWTASSGATSYNALRSTVNGSGYVSVATGIATTNYTNTGLTNGTTYYFVVTATNASGTSGNSNQASATPQVAAPPAPTGLTATPGNAQVGLSWSASTGATAYDVKRSTVSGSGYVTVSSPTVTNYTNTGLTNGTTYYFVVDAKNAGGTSANSSQVSATPTAGGGTPVIEINSGGSAAGSWIADADFSGGGTFTTGATIDTSAVTNPAPVAVYQAERDGTFTYTIPGLTANTQYTVRLHFAETNFNGAGLREFNVSINSTQVLTNFDIWATAGAENKANIQTFTATANGSGQIVIAFTVGAANNPKVSGIEIDTLGGSPPPAPTGLTATPGNAQAALAWTASSGATSYNALRSTVSGSSYASVATGISTTSYTNTGLTNGTTYYFVVTATNASGTSGNSNQASATPAAAPPAPTGLTATPGNAQVALAWNASTGATAYDVKRSTVSGSGYVTVSSPATTSYTNTGLTNGATYYFVVDAKNASGTSANSAQASATPVAPPAAPAGLTATPGNAQVALSWSASSGTTAYDVKRSTVSGSGYVTVSSPTTTSYTNTGLTNGTTYYFVVDAKNAGGTSANSSQVSATPSLTPVIQINSGGSATGSWIADADFSGGGTFTTGATIDTSAVANPAPMAVYQSERDGQFTYTIPGLTANAAYTVRLHFAETNFNGAGLREFNVAINSTTVLANFDIWATAGAENKANIQTFTTNANASGQIIIAFTNGAANNPKSSGIEILH